SKAKKRGKKARPETELPEEQESVNEQIADEETVVEEVGEAAAEPALQEIAEEWREKYLRTLAELDNFRKRSERDSSHVRKYALEGFLRNLLPVLDALHMAADAEGDAKAIRDGVVLALNDAMRILGEKGVEEIEALDELFDPRWHEAVGMLPAEDCPPGTVVKEERKGYRMHDRVLRPSRVHISMRLPEAAEKTTDDSSEAAVEED
ncbi:MAG: nucleotide exchange factor GrpE, partial [Planctomycetota bacterium]